MIVVTLNEALNILGYDIFTKYIKYMCKETYNMWFDKYYSKHLDIYPTYESLSMVYINLANNIKTNNYYQGYILLNNEDKENNKVIGYVSINFNDYCIVLSGCQSICSNAASVILSNTYCHHPQYLQ